MAVKTYETEVVTIKIDHDKCKGHKACVEICPSQVFEMVNDKATAPRVADCVECCACVDACPEKAIEHSSC